MTKALTLHQPWASLVACGAKSIETRSWSTDYRGPLLIHAGLTFNYYSYPALSRHLFRDDEPGVYKVSSHPPVPLGAIVASCTLTDCVPIYDQHDHAADHAGDYVTAGSSGTVYLWQPYDQEPHTEHLRDYPGEAPFGDFTPGRFAWLLDDVKPTTERCPACWGLGSLPRVSAKPAGPHRTPCPVCGLAGACEPLSARGRQGLWEWTP